jgi:hypothetical protein
MPKYLCALGLEVEIPAELQEDPCALDIWLADENIIRQLPNKPVAYAIWARLVALRPNVILEASQLASAWDQGFFRCQQERRLLFSSEDSTLHERKS